MRDYLYIWNDADERLLVASGIEFRDLVPAFTTGGLVLLKHDFLDADHDEDSGLSFLPVQRLSELASEDIYGWGEFHFADYREDAFPRISPDQVAELLYFGHLGRPLRGTRIEHLGNRFLCSTYDDGWAFQARYTEWGDIEHLLVVAGISRDVTAMVNERSTEAIWVSEGGHPEPEVKTLDIDSVLNRRA